MIPLPQGSKFDVNIAIGGALAKAAAEGLHEYGTIDDKTAAPLILDHLRNSAVNYFGSNWGK